MFIELTRRRTNGRIIELILTWVYILQRKILFTQMNIWSIRYGQGENQNKRFGIMIGIEGNLVNEYIYILNYA